jgi:uncharacterized Zn-finger protein
MSKDKTMSEFWEDLAITLLEHNLSGNSLNSRALKDMFKDRPEIWDELDIQVDGEGVEDLDSALYAGNPQVIEIREAKPNEVYHCKPCNRTFKRGDNFRRHLRSGLHEKRMRAFELAAQERIAEPKEVLKVES